MADEIINAEPIQEPAEETLVTQEADETEETLLTKDAGDEDGSQEDAAEDKGVVPDKYDVKVPEGMELDAETLELFTPVFKELGITQEGAQKLVDAYAPIIQKQAEEFEKKAKEDYKKIVDGWKENSIKELGADSDKKLAYAAKARNKFADKEFNEMANETGIGNHPALVRLLIKVGQTIGEDVLIDSDKKKSEVDPLKVIYPTMHKT